jgi:hypothetical protein
MLFFMGKPHSPGEKRQSSVALLMVEIIVSGFAVLYPIYGLFKPRRYQTQFSLLENPEACHFLSVCLNSTRPGQSDHSALLTKYNIVNDIK